MNKEYAHHDSAGWVERSAGVTLSRLGRAVAQTLGVVGGGIYNAPINVDAIDWTRDMCLEVYWRGGMANWDSPKLALLLIECHRRMLRVEIEPGNMQGIRLAFHQRKSREGATWERLPRLESLIETVEDWYG